MYLERVTNRKRDYLQVSRLSHSTCKYFSNPTLIKKINNEHQTSNYRIVAIRCAPKLILLCFIELKAFHIPSVLLLYLYITAFRPVVFWWRLLS